jgi:hypothetical protein
MPDETTAESLPEPTPPPEPDLPDPGQTEYRADKEPQIKFTRPARPDTGDIERSGE